MKPTKIGGYEKGKEKLSELCFDVAGNGLPCPDEFDTTFVMASEEFREHCISKCAYKVCVYEVWSGVYRPELGDYWVWEWTVGCDKECGEVQGKAKHSKY